MRKTLLSAVSVVIAVILLGLLYAYAFVWDNTPNLARLLGLDA